MLGTARLLTFAFRSVVLLLLLPLVWIAVADRYNRAIVSVANPILPAGASATAIGSRLVLEGPNVAPPVYIDGYALPRIHRWTGMDGVRTAEGVRELQAR